MRKYTKGKWEITKKGSQTIVSVGTAYIAIVMPNHVGKDEAEANAKLIVSAPELMTAFVNAVNYWIAHEPINFLEDIAMTEAQELIKEITK